MPEEPKASPLQAKGKPQQTCLSSHMAALSVHLGVIIGNSLLDVLSEVGEGGTIARKDKRALSSSALTSGSSREKFWAISGA